MRLRIIHLILIIAGLFGPLVPKIGAVAVKPFPPFSEEGNPPENYHFDGFFPLMRYIRPPAMEIYENLERNRNYEDFIVCPDGDERDYKCSVDAETGEVIDTCDGGDVAICFKVNGEAGDEAYTDSSGPNNSCSARATLSTKGIVNGKCSYRQQPNIKRKILGTDFSENDSLAFPKIQSGSRAYINVGNDNAITWGSTYLQLSQGDRLINQLLVVTRAKQTKATLNETGEWPLGWVDWGYQVKIDEDRDPLTPPSTKTLIEIHDELPGGLSGAGMAIAESVDDFFLTGGNIEIVSDVSDTRESAVQKITEELAKKNPAEWAIDLSQVPPYPPSFRQGFWRPSICVWDICCPGARCKIEPIGTRRGLYYDITISQAFGGALDNLFLTYPMDEAIDLFKKIADTNPLIRFSTSADTQATPTEINKRLEVEFKDRYCLKYVPWGGFLGFGTHIDYLDPEDPLDPAGKCPNYRLAPDLTKENAQAFVTSPLSVLLSLLWGQSEDEVDPTWEHLITVPEAMGQSIQELQQPFYDSRDTVAELESVKEYNEGQSNTIDDEAQFLFGGETSLPADAKRRVAYYTCDDNMFSAQLSTSIEAYAMGTRIGCFDTTDVPETTCDGQAFGKLIEGSGYEASSVKGEEYFTSYIEGNLTPELMNTYAAAEKETGVPCEILAGIHFVEASNSPEGSLVSGRKIGSPEPDAGGKVFRSLLETAKYAGDHLKGKVSGNLSDVESVITALSRYNGGGNSNCQSGYPYPIPYSGCPRAFEGEDDPYPTSMLDGKHDSMYLLYCADHTACAPQIFERPGSFTVALNVYNSITKDGYKNTDLPEEQENPPAPPVVDDGGESGSSGFFPDTCGTDSLSTALGCIPYTKEAFISALLGFLAGISGAIALVVMLVSTIQIMLASGDAKKLQSAKELFTSAVIGLLFLIFSVSLLRLIAGDIIKLPGF